MSNNDKRAQKNTEYQSALERKRAQRKEEEQKKKAKMRNRIIIIAGAVIAVFAIAFCVYALAGSGNGSGTDVESSVLPTGDPYFTVEPKVGKFYVPDGNFNNFIVEEINFDGTIDDVVEKLAAHGNFPETVKVKDFHCIEYVAFIDFNSAYGEYLSTGASAISQFAINGLVKTIYDCFGVTEVHLTVNGKELSSGHGTVTNPVQVPLND